RDVSHAETFVELILSTGESCKTYLLTFRMLLNLFQVWLRTGFDEQSYAEVFRRHHRYPNLCAVRNLGHTGILVFDMAREDQWKLQKLLDDCLWISGAGNDVNDVDRLYPTSQRSGHAYLNHAIDRFEIFNYLIRGVPGVMQMQTALGLLDRRCELLQQTLFSLWSKPFHLAQPTRFGSGF